MSQNEIKIMKDILVILLGLLSLIYLINPTIGVVEIIPDNFPIIGNLDEAAACAILLSVLRYFGIDLTSLLRLFLKPDNQKNS